MFYVPVYAMLTQHAEITQQQAELEQLKKELQRYRDAQELGVSVYLCQRL